MCWVRVRIQSQVLNQHRSEPDPARELGAQEKPCCLGAWPPSPGKNRRQCLPGERCEHSASRRLPRAGTARGGAALERPRPRPSTKQEEGEARRGAEPLGGGRCVWCGLLGSRGCTAGL